MRLTITTFLYCADRWFEIIHIGREIFLHDHTLDAKLVAIRIKKNILLLDSSTRWIVLQLAFLAEEKTDIFHSITLKSLFKSCSLLFWSYQFSIWRIFTYDLIVPKGMPKTQKTKELLWKSGQEQKEPFSNT